MDHHLSTAQPGHVTIPKKRVPMAIDSNAQMFAGSEDFNPTESSHETWECSTQSEVTLTEIFECFLLSLHSQVQQQSMENDVSEDSNVLLKARPKEETEND